jgi:Flp pilus assembly protein TadD
MSLLLDALRRAEQAKRAKGAGAEPTGATAPITPDPGLSAARSRATSASKPPLNERARGNPYDELTLEDTVPAPAAEHEFAPQEESQPRATPSIGHRDRAASTNTGANTGAASGAPQETARRVFVAKETLAMEPARSPWALLAVAAGVVAIGAMMWFGWQQFSHLGSLKNPVTARAPGDLPPASPTLGQPKLAPAGVAAPPLPSEQIIPPLLPPPLASAKPPADAPSSPVAPRALSERELLVRSLQSSRTVREPPVSLKLSPKIEVAVSPQMSEAYSVLLRGDYADAKKRYTELVQTAPLNIDGHLGLAAAAARSGDAPLARRAYQRALELDPRNQTAIAGLLAMNDAATPETVAAELRKQIALNPNAAALHFALGNAYASDRRWSEAQQSYFEAYRLDGSNADTIYNLAVSLDQLGQTRLALEHYDKALAAAARSTAQFDRAAIARRIAELQGARTP